MQAVNHGVDLSTTIPPGNLPRLPVLKLQGRTDEAIACFRDALALRPGYAEAWNNLGTGLTEGGRTGEAVSCFRTAIVLAQDLPNAHFNLATVLLALGEMEEGWQELEWRWATPQMASERRIFTQPRWRGGPGEGWTLLIHAEQGFGDTLQFCRYAPKAAGLGWSVVLEVQKQLVQLLRGMPEVRAVVARGAALPGFDFHCPMMSMPLAFGTTTEDVPAGVPYLRPEDTKKSVWRDRISFLPGRGLRVGLAWAGSARLHSTARAAVDRRRSLPPDMLCRLLDVPGITFFSLQKGGPALPKDAQVIDLMPGIEDFADTAALVAYLAGAMGKPVWMLDRFDPCWRWLARREDSPWYPTLRIFRQQEPGDWCSVVDAVQAELAELATAR